MTALAAEIESLPPATLYLTLSKLSTKGLRLLLDESISVVSDRLNTGDTAASQLRDLQHVKAAPVTSAPTSGQDTSDDSAPPGLPAQSPPAAVEPAASKAPDVARCCARADGHHWRRASDKGSDPDHTGLKRKGRWCKTEEDSLVLHRRCLPGPARRGG